MQNLELGKKVCVIGLGRTGIQSALFLNRKGYEVFASEGKKSLELLAASEKLMDQGIDVEVGSHDLSKILTCDWVLVSPGISPRQKIYLELKRAGKLLLSEIELAYRFSKTSKIIAVTGTAGKTTVTTLVAQILKNANKSAHLCGNIGTPWIEKVESIQAEDYVVVEVSSFQLMNCHSFRPFIGMLLNVSPNHLDWHVDMEEYVLAKLKLFQSQEASDKAFVRRKDYESLFSKYKFRASVHYLDEDKKKNPNEEALRLVAEALQIPGSAVQKALDEFEGIAHRLDLLVEKDGVRYVNDSKCTTPASLKWALSHFDSNRVILIAGGKPKSNDFCELSELIREKVKHAILIGHGQSILADAWEEACPIYKAAGFREAVQFAHQHAKKGDVVLLSPACASFDMFKNYEERGQVFAKIVMDVTQTMTTKDYVKRS